MNTKRQQNDNRRCKSIFVLLYFFFSCSEHIVLKLRINLPFVSSFCPGPPQTLETPLLGHVLYVSLFQNIKLQEVVTLLLFMSQINARPHTRTRKGGEVVTVARATPSLTAAQLVRTFAIQDGCFASIGFSFFFETQHTSVDVGRVTAGEARPKRLPVSEPGESDPVRLSTWSFLGFSAFLNPW